MSARFRVLLWSRARKRAVSSAELLSLGLTCKVVEYRVKIRGYELFHTFAAAKVKPDTPVLALHAQLEHEKGTALALQFDPLGHITKRRFASVNLK